MDSRELLKPFKRMLKKRTAAQQRVYEQRKKEHARFMKRKLDTEECIIYGGGAGGREGR